MLSLILFRYKTGSPHTRFYTQPHIQYRPPPTGIERALQEHRALLERLVLWLLSFGYTPHTHTSESLSHSLTHTPTHTPWKKAVTENFWKKDRRKKKPKWKEQNFFHQARKKEKRKKTSQHYWPAILTTLLHNQTLGVLSWQRMMERVQGWSQGHTECEEREEVCVYRGGFAEQICQYLFGVNTARHPLCLRVCSWVCLCVRAVGVGARSTSLC